MPTLAEDLMLLLLDDETGRPLVNSTSADNALAGAVLLDLVHAERVDAPEDKKLRVRDASPLGDPVLDAGLQRLGDKDSLKPQRAVELLRKNVRKAVLDQLVNRGLVRREESKVLGLFPRTSWPAVDSAHEDEVRTGLAAALVDGEQPDARAGGLVALLHAVNAVHKVVDGDKKALRARAKQISEDNWAGTAVKKAVQAVQAGVIAATTAAAVVSGS
jgi:hypothetical protein